MKKTEKQKKKKEKIIYVDDGSTISDMSALRKSPKADPNPYAGDQKPMPRWRQILGTYFDSMKLMFLPTLAIVGLVAVAFLLIWLLLQLAS